MKRHGTGGALSGSNQIARTGMTDQQGHTHMRKLIAIIAAIGFIGSTTLSPVLAAQATPGVAKSDEFSAAAKKKGKKSAKKSKKADNVILYRVAA
jgi:hypothetical protein